MKKFNFVPYTKMDGVMWRLNFEKPVPCLITFMREIDMTSAEVLQASYKAAGKTKPSYTALLAKSIASALVEHPYANRRVFSWPFFQRAIQFQDINISVAVEQEDELMQAGVETLYKADGMALGEISRRIASMRDPNSQAHQRWEMFSKMANRLPRFLTSWLADVPRFSPSLWLEHRGGSVLITSPAKYGVDAISGFWHWPVTFSFGLIKPRPIVIDEEIAIRRTMTLGMIFDGRIMAGAPAARFFNGVAEKMEDAENSLRSEELNV